MRPGESRVVDTVQSAADLRRQVSDAGAQGKKIGLVPTMGALHDGHLRLIEQCRAETEFVVVSIFVNPTQFGAGEDLNRYPRPLEDDLRYSASAGADLVFVPSVETMYPYGVNSTFVEVAGLSDIFEGASRPGHFRGVSTVVLKLFEMVRPDVAVFGQKDYQQQLLVRRMVADLHIPVQLSICPTVREPDGLALSSRNRYLNPPERRAAVVLYRALEGARAAADAGERRGDRIRQFLHETLKSEPMAEVDYAEVANAETLERLGDLGGKQRAVALVAVRFGTTRLIDNALLTR
jgi:pantoate--beta-alanine ligase